MLTRPSNVSPNHNGRKARIASASIIFHPQRRIASIIVTAHAAPKQRRIRIRLRQRKTTAPTCDQGKPDQLPQGWIDRWCFHLTRVLNGPTRRCHDKSGRAT